MAKIIRIDSCGRCPHRGLSEYAFGDDICYLYMSMNEEKRIIADWNEIPDWCPLEDAK